MSEFLGLVGAAMSRVDLDPSVSPETGDMFLYAELPPAHRNSRLDIIANSHIHRGRQSRQAPGKAQTTGCGIGAPWRRQSRRTSPEITPCNNAQMGPTGGRAGTDAHLKTGARELGELPPTAVPRFYPRLSDP